MTVRLTTRSDVNAENRRILPEFRCSEPTDQSTWPELPGHYRAPNSEGRRQIRRAHDGLAYQPPPKAWNSWTIASGRATRTCPMVFSAWKSALWGLSQDSRSTRPARGCDSEMS